MLIFSTIDGAYLFLFIIFSQQSLYIALDIRSFLVSLHYALGHFSRQCLIVSVWFPHAAFILVCLIRSLFNLTLYCLQLLWALSPFNAWFDVIQCASTVFQLPLPFGVSSSPDSQVVIPHSSFIFQVVIRLIYEFLVLQFVYILINIH